VLGTISSNSTTKPSSISSASSTHQLVTPACATKLVVQTDGNVVFSDVNNGKVYWSSNTGGKGVGPYTLTMQNDGNLVLSDSRSSSLWTSGTSGVGACAPYSFKVRDITKLTVVDCNSEPLWSA